MIIDTSRKVNFGIYRGTMKTHYGKVDTGIFKDKKLDIYYSYENNELKHKLYYLQDKLGNWLKSKLVFFKDNKPEKVVRSNIGDKPL